MTVLRDYAPVETLDAGRIQVCRLPRTAWTLVNVYAPANAAARAQFWPRLRSVLQQQLPRRKMLVAGDFNVDLEQDGVAADALRELLQDFDLVDCVHEPTRLGRTLDHVFVHQEDANRVVAEVCRPDGRYSSAVDRDHGLPMHNSDHRPVVVTVRDGPWTHHPRPDRPPPFPGPGFADAVAADLHTVTSWAALSELLVSAASRCPAPMPEQEHVPAPDGLPATAGLLQLLSGWLRRWVVTLRRGQAIPPRWIASVTAALATLAAAGLLTEESVPASPSTEWAERLAERAAQLYRMSRDEEHLAAAAYLEARMRAATEWSDNLSESGQWRRWLNLVGGGPRRTDPAAVFDDADELLLEPEAVRARTQQFFARTARPPAVVDTSAIARVAPRGIRTPRDLEEPLQAIMSPFTEEEVLAAARALTLGKSPGPDGVRPDYVREAAEHLAPLLTRWFTDVLSSGQWPAGWSSATMVLIPKSESHFDGHLEETRPICLLPVLARLFLKLVADRITPLLADLLHPAQAGFLPGRGTAEHIMAMRLMLEHSRLRHSDMAVLLLDIRKAYDTVPWAGLDAALERLGFPAAFRRLVQRMHISNEARVRTAHGPTDPVRLHRGVLQGSPLSCALFLAFIDPLVCMLDQPDVAPVQVGDARCAVMAYADDLAVTSTTVTGLQWAASAAERWLRAMDMELNARKCVAAATAPLAARRDQVCLSGGEVPVLAADAGWRYLGVVFDCDGSWRDQYAALRGIIASKARFFQRRSLSDAQARYLVQAVLFAALLYRMQFGCCSAGVVARLQTAVDRLVRQALRLPSGLCREALHLPPELLGCGIPRLQPECDAAMLSTVCSALDRPDTPAGQLLRATLNAARRSACLPLPVLDDTALAAAVTPQRSLVGLVAAAANRLAILRVRCPELSAVMMTNPRVYMDTDGSRFTSPVGTPLCSVLPLAVWRARRKQLAAFNVYYVEQIATPDGLALLDYRTVRQRRLGAQAAASGRVPLWWRELERHLLRSGVYGTADRTLRTAVGVAPGMSVYPPLAHPIIRRLRQETQADARGDVLAAHVHQWQLDGEQRLRGAGRDLAAVLQAEPDVQAEVYTDGSFDPTAPHTAQAGAACVIRHGAEERQCTLRLKARTAASSYDVEMLAAVAALRRCRNVRRVTIITDNQAVIATATMARRRADRRYAQSRPAADLVNELGKLLQERRSRGFMTSWRHVYAHRGDPGNELADKLAAQARADAPRPFTEQDAAEQVAVLCGGARLVLVGRDGRRVSGGLRARARAVDEAALIHTRFRHGLQGHVFVAGAGVAYAGDAANSDLPAALDRRPNADPAEERARLAALCPQLPWWARGDLPQGAWWRKHGRRAVGAAHLLLPTRAHMWRRGRCDTDLCPRCEVRDTALHVLCECSAHALQRDTWQAAAADLQLRFMSTLARRVPTHLTQAVRALAVQPPPVAVLPAALLTATAALSDRELAKEVRAWCSEWVACAQSYVEAVWRRCWGSRHPQRYDDDTSRRVTPT